MTINMFSLNPNNKLPPLHLGKLNALLCDDDDAKCENIAAAKRFFAKGAMREGVLRLLKAFDFKFRLYEYKDDYNK